MPGAAAVWKSKGWEDSVKNTRPMSQCDILSGAKTRGFDRSGYAFPRQGALPGSPRSKGRAAKRCVF